MAQTAKRETALIVGAGSGLGAALARCFSAAGMTVAVAARDKERIEALARTVSAASGGKLAAYALDATDEAGVRAMLEDLRGHHGEPDLVVYNAGAYRPANVIDIETADFEQCWRAGCLGGFILGREAARGMAERGAGTILFTGATASLRGGAGFANLAVGKFGLRALAQSMARELGPRGVHIGHVLIDGGILEENDPRDRGDETLLNPDAIAANYLHLHRQPRSAWTLELDLRPWCEKF